MLNVIVFVCGAALMALEIVAARVLAPSLGNSIFVWGSVISTVMIALSAGYWAGGQIADRAGASRIFAPLIAGAGALTVLAPPVAKAVLPWSAGLGPRLGSLAAASLIFFAPALLLATISPLGVRLAASRGMERIGRSAGNLYAVSTGGSIFGTLATSFWIIPALSLEPLIVSIGFLLFATSVLSLALPRLYTEPAVAGAIEPPRRRALGPVSATLALVLAGSLAGAWVLARVAPPTALNERGERVLFRTDSQYHRISVTERAGVRYLRFDKSNQTALDMTDGYTSRNRYPNYIDLALAAKPDAKRVLVLGLGGGAIPKRWWHDYPDMRVDVVEIDPAVIDVAQRYFGLPDDPRLRVVNQDARRFVQASPDSYDVVVVDCYYADSVPFHLTTEEFFREVKSRMAPDGVLAYNVIGSVSGEQSKLFRSTYRTAEGVFSKLAVFPIGISADGDRRLLRNVIVLATDADVSDADITTRTRNRVGGRVRLEGFPGFADDLYAAPIETSDVPVLTDSHAPVDQLIKVM